MQLMHRCWATIVLLSVCGAVLHAQQGPGPRRQLLQQQVMQQLMENYRAQSGISDEQFTRLRDVMTQSLLQRAELQQRERELWMALEGQMRPGVAADADSLVGLMDALLEVQSQVVALHENDQLKYSEFLSPVQRAQLMLATRRFQNSVNQIMQRRMQQGRPPMEE